MRLAVWIPFKRLDRAAAKEVSIHRAAGTLERRRRKWSPMGYVHIITSCQQIPLKVACSEEKPKNKRIQRELFDSSKL